MAQHIVQPPPGQDSADFPDSLLPAIQQDDDTDYLAD
jgi:hypothetical protein